MRIYLDHNAGAPLRAAARDAMLAAMGPPANPSSPHREGARARALLEDARAAVAALIGAAPAEIVFTSGATEANTLALLGGLPVDGRIVTTVIEHASVLAPARAHGAPLVELPVDGDARITAAAVVAACNGGPALASIGLANGEVGTVAPVAEIAAALRGRPVTLHTDAAQAVGRIPVDVHALGVDLLSLSSHKLGGPAGVGALWVRAGFALRPQLLGGPQERGRRAGTENVVGIVGFGAAARAVSADHTATTRMAALAERLWSGLRTQVPDVVRLGPVDGPRLPNTVNVRVPGCSGESLLMLLDLGGVAASLGSACSAGAPEPSHVLMAMGLARETARDGLRLSLGPDTTADDIDAVVGLLPGLVRQVRGGAAA
ncbi:MAG TPA: cysteine desulfurase family protein [Candidatus Binatia bacterium]|jgi:cysteine desulfurase|nr:cysteine desulfurase family protein [Candidatus Binatia bacterium]